MKEWEDREIREAQQSWLIRFPREIYRTIRSWFYFLPDVPKKIKWNYQTLTKGYCDCDVWNLNDFILKKIRKPFKAFIRYEEEHGHSLPWDFQTDPAGWLVTLADIEYALDDWWKHDYEDDYSINIMKLPDEERKAHTERVNKGFLLLGKYCRDFWD